MLGFASLWSGEPVAELWRRTLARPCPVGVTSPDCLLTLPGQVRYRFDELPDTATDFVSLYVRVRDAPPYLHTYAGGAYADLTPESAARLSITWRPDETPVTVTVFGPYIVAITGPNGVTADAEDINDPIFGAHLMVLFLTTGAGLVLAAGGYLWRRLRGGTTEWIGWAVGSTMVGAVAAVVAGHIAAGRFGVAWAMPVTYAVMIGVSLAVLWVRIPESMWDPVRSSWNSSERQDVGA